MVWVQREAQQKPQDTRGGGAPKPSSRLSDNRNRMGRTQAKLGSEERGKLSKSPWMPEGDNDPLTSQEREQEKEVILPPEWTATGCEPPDWAATRLQQEEKQLAGAGRKCAAGTRKCARERARLWANQHTSTHATVMQQRPKNCATKWRTARTTVCKTSACRSTRSRK